MNSRAVVAYGLIGLGLLAATVRQARSASAPPVRAVPAAPRTRTVAAEGRVVAYPGAEVVVGTERSGRLVAVRVLEGQSVRAGETIAELDADELRASLTEARARIAEAEAEIRLAEANFKRREPLVEQQIVAVRDLDEARRDVETARARRDTAQAEAERYEAQIRKTRILAPISGTVIARQVDAGETIDSGKPVATLADLGRLRIEGEADEADAAALALGAPVAILCDAYPGRSWKGRVEEIADAVTLRKLKPQDPSRPTDTRILAVKVAFAEPSPLKLGTTVELKIAAR